MVNYKTDNKEKFVFFFGILPEQPHSYDAKIPAKLVGINGRSKILQPQKQDWYHAE